LGRGGELWPSLFAVVVVVVVVVAVVVDVFV
jgi:hypothetical protein